jgi:hypothetical protein
MSPVIRLALATIPFPVFLSLVDPIQLPHPASENARSTGAQLAAARRGGHPQRARIRPFCPVLQASMRSVLGPKANSPVVSVS